MKTLVIVESPAKARKIGSFLGSDYTVRASCGHIRDLPNNEMGVEPPFFKPKYVTGSGKSKIVSDLKCLAKSHDNVILATDIDREGEAIAWHLAEVLKLDSPDRLVFNQINKSAILKALESPRKIDMKIVAAQEARRVLDRRIGFRVSGFTRKLFGESFPSGRVQSPSVKFVYERRQEIDNHVPVNYLQTEIEIEKDGLRLVAKLDIADFADKAVEFNDEDIAQQAAVADSVCVIDIEAKKVIRKSPAPFITTTLHQRAMTKLGVNLKKSTSIAQELYQEGLITYIRSDAPGLSPEALANIRSFGEAAGHSLSDEPKVFEAKAGAQEAHEGIYPTDMNVQTVIGISDKFGDLHEKMYQLIWARTLACQMEDGIDLKTVIKLESDEGFRYMGSGLAEELKGWRSIYDDGDSGKEASAAVPNLSAELASQEAMPVVDRRVISKATKPPALYTESTILKVLESKGIARPATISSVIDSITSRHNYVESVGKRNVLDITPRGRTLVESLNGEFRFMDYGYTKDLELDIDDISNGKTTFLKVVAEADDLLSQELEGMTDKTVVNHSAKDRKPCEVDGCSGHYVSRMGGKFEGCTNFPECKSTINLPQKGGAKKSSKTAAKKGGAKKRDNTVYTNLEVDCACPACSEGTVRVLTVKKAGPNVGKQFFGCSVFKCGLFQWLELGQVGS